jgi:hypothetical protein
MSFGESATLAANEAISNSNTRKTLDVRVII